MFKNFKNRLFTSLSLFLLIYLILINEFVLVLSLIIFGVISLLEFFDIIQRIFKKKIPRYFFNFLFINFIFFFCLIFFILSNFHQLKFIIFLILLTCVASDLGGFVFGKILKGPKLINISPNKTVSGSIGSLIFSLLFFSSVIYYYTDIINYQILIISILISISSQVGDLFFSFLKRKAKIKDSGNFLPGHGGILDRLDSVFFGLPLGLILIIFLKPL